MTGRPRAGRPPRITPEDIAAAALRIGLDRATVRSVADELGVSVPGLYHHVRTREQLLEMAMAHSFKLLPKTLDRSEPWNVVLLRYAEDIYNNLANQPELINLIVSGSIVSAGHALHLDVFLEGACKRGFTPREAYEVFAQVMNAVIGAAALEAGDRAMARKGQSMLSKLKVECAMLAPDETAHLREVVRDPTAEHLDRFDAVRTMLEGLVVRFGKKVTTVPTKRSASASEA